MLFDWDAAKHERNLRERGFGFDFACLVFKGDVIEAMDDRREYGEVRMRALGEVAGQVLAIVYTDRIGPTGRRKGTGGMARTLKEDCRVIASGRLGEAHLDDR